MEVARALFSAHCLPYVEFADDLLYLPVQAAEVYRPTKFFIDFDELILGRFLTDYFHKAEFRHGLILTFYSLRLQGQKDAILRVLSGQSTLVITPTGSGKSLCYQLPAMLLAKGCFVLVITPLVSLIADQLQHLPAPLKGTALHGHQSVLICFCCAYAFREMNTNLYVKALKRENSTFCLLLQKE